MMRRLLGGLSLALAYLVAGKLGLMLALPPGYASGIFPAAGLAVGAAYLWGRRTLLWIFLGSLLLNLWVGASSTSATTTAAATCVALASALQAWWGCAVLRAALGRRTRLDSDTSVTRYLLLSPVIALVSASISVLSLFGLGVVGAGERLETWGFWWLGDTLGIAAVFPMVLALFGTPRVMWRRRRVVVVATMGIALALVVTSYVRVSQSEQQRISKEFQFRAMRFVDLVQDRVKEQSYLLQQLDTVLSRQRTQRLTQEDFAAYVQPTLQRFPMLQAIEWAPQVTVTERPSFEASRRLTPPGVEITERTDSGVMRPAANRPLYYPVTFLAPIPGNESAIGFDLGSSPARYAAVRAALDGDTPVATEPLKLVQEQGAQAGILLIQGIRQGADAPGVVLTVLRVGTLIESAQPKSEQLEVALRDLTLGRDLYGAPPPHPSTMSYARTLRLGGRDYQLLVTPSERYMMANRSLQGWALLVAGALSTGLLGAILLLVTGMTARVQNLVEERTRQLALESGKHRTLLQTASDGIHVMDERGDLIEFNEAFARMLGYTPEEVSRLNIADWDVAIPKERLLAVLGDLIQSPTTFETRHRRKDGSTFDVEINATGLRLEGRPYLYASARDISERKRLEEASRLLVEQLQRTNAELEQFAFVASHDLRAPLRAIESLSEWIEEDLAGKLSTESVEHLRLLRGRVRRMNALLNDLLQYARAGRAGTELSEVDTNVLVAEIADSLALSPRMELRTTQLPRLRTAVSPLRQVFHNLFSNALKHHDRQRGTLSVAAEHHNGVWEFTVADDGPGIPEQHRARVFEMFETLKPRDELESSGMGLALVKKLVESHGGAVSLENAEPRGTLVRFTWPVEAPLESPPDGGGSVLQ